MNADIPIPRPEVEWIDIILAIMELNNVKSKYICILRQIMTLNCKIIISFLLYFFKIKK